MATITCLPDGKTISLEPSETILEADLKADIPHAHACGGRAKCSTCRIIILKGLENCSPRTELEQVIASQRASTSRANGLPPMKLPTPWSVGHSRAEKTG